MTMTIYKDFTFDSAHRLTGVPVGHKCANMHGHTYTLRVFITGDPDERGMIIDYGDLENIVKPIIRQVDHRTLNDIPGLENPTTEVLAPWLWRKVKEAIPSLRISVLVKESTTTGCLYMEDLPDPAPGLKRGSDL